MPHDFTIDSSHLENGRQLDPNYVSVELSGGLNGKRDVHVYLSNPSTESRKYNNATVVKESLTKKSKRGRERDPQSWSVSS